MQHTQHSGYTNIAMPTVLTVSTAAMCVHISECRHGGQVHALHDDANANCRVGPQCDFLRQEGYQFTSNMEIVRRIVEGCSAYKRILPRTSRQQQDSPSILNARLQRLTPVQGEGLEPAFIQTSDGVVVPWAAYFASLKGWVLESSADSNTLCRAQSARWRLPPAEGAIPVVKHECPDAAKDGLMLDTINEFLRQRNEFRAANGVSTTKRQKRQSGADDKSVAKTAAPGWC